MTSGFYTCDSSNDCSNKEIVCMFGGGSCHILCKAPYSCQNTIMKVESPATTLGVECLVNNSCPNANMSDIVYVIGNGENALNGATINCLNSRDCDLLCEDPLSCANAIIKGTQTSNLDLQCNSYEACHNIDIHCPKSGQNSFNCEIHGNAADLYDIHDDFNIYAPNGWSDVSFDNYNALVTGGNMYCGGDDAMDDFVGNDTDGYECEIEYGIFDCQDITSPCTDQTWFNDNREYFIMDDDDTEGGLIQCDPYTNVPGTSIWQFSACNLICRGDNACNNNIEFQCPASKKECNVICSGDNSCQGIKVNAQPFDTFSYDVNIICGKEGNDDACQNSYLSAPDRMNDRIFRVNLFGKNNLVGATINCPVSGSVDCDIRCQNDNSCKSGNILSTSLFQDIYLQCNGEEDSCSDLNVTVSDIGQFVVKGLSKDNNNNLNIYSVNSWGNLDLSEWYNKSVSGDNNIMNCGSNYENSCIINSNFTCQCLVDPTPMPTRSPLGINETYSPTESPTKSPTSDDSTSDSWYITAVVFIVLFACTALILVYFAWVIYSADEKATQQTYGHVNEVEAGNLDTPRNNDSDN